MAEQTLDQRRAVSPDRRRTITSDGIPSFRYAVHHVRGSEVILGMRKMLVAFSERCGQAGTMDDLAYFLSKPGLLKRVPSLFLIVKRNDLRLEELGVDDLLGALFLYEYHMMGMGMRAYATNDRSGRGTMLALPHQRLKAAAIFSRVLLDRGARVIMLSFRAGTEEEGKENTELFKFLPASQITAEWAWREREIPGYLPLQESYDATLATLGTKTRRNMRYYRRLAEKDLGCRLIPSVEIGREEYLAFNRECMFPVADSVALWRLETMKELGEPVLMGLKDREGRWLALLGGRRFKDDRMEILWQMNRAGMHNHSLSTAMRAYCIDQEVERGTKRLYIEGGTAHSLHHAFVPEELIDLVVVRKSPLTKPMKKFAANKIYPDNALGELLKSPDVIWHPC